MATKKAVAKTAKKAPVKAQETRKPETRYDMPREVSEWVERAHSTIQHLRGEVERLKKENADLKTYKRWAEKRILRAEVE